MMRQTGVKRHFGLLMIFITLILIVGISSQPIAAAPGDLITVTVDSGDTLYHSTGTETLTVRERISLRLWYR